MRKKTRPYRETQHVFQGPIWGPRVVTREPLGRPFEEMHVSRIANVKTTCLSLLKLGLCIGQPVAMRRSSQ